MPAPRKAYPLRIEPELFDAIERLAGAELRSTNAQIECLLREALDRRGVRLEPAAKRARGRPPSGASGNPPPPGGGGAAGDGGGGQQ